MFNMDNFSDNEKFSASAPLFNHPNHPLHITSSKFYKKLEEDFTVEFSALRRFLLLILHVVIRRFKYALLNHVRCFELLMGNGRILNLVLLALF
jgi:hypothetical protein